MAPPFASYGPSWTEYKKNFLGPALAGGIVVLAGMAVARWLRFGWWMPVIVVLVAALPVGYLVMYFRLLRVTLDGTNLRYTSSFGFSRSWPLDRATTAVITDRLLPIGATGGVQNSGRNLFVFDEKGKRLFRLSSGAWALSDLHAIVAALPKAHVREVDRTITEAELNRLQPHSTPWAERHPYLFAFAFTLGLLATIGAAVLLVGTG